MVKWLDQGKRDRERQTYELMFGPDLDGERVTAALNRLVGALRTDSGILNFASSVPAIAFEVWGTHTGVRWLVRIPWRYEGRVRLKLEHIVPGLQMIRMESPPRRDWTYAIEVGLTGGHRPLRLDSQADMSTALLGDFGKVKADQTLMMQWVVLPAAAEHKPLNGDPTRENTFYTFLTGQAASADEIKDRRDKADQANFMGVARIAAKAETKGAAQYMVKNVLSTLRSTEGAAHRFNQRLIPMDMLQQRIDVAATPLFGAPIQLTSTELAAVLAWPLNNPLVPGVPSPTSRYIPAATTVPSVGIVLGRSNYHGDERRVAIGYNETVLHQHTLGPPGTGKTVLAINKAAQLIKAGRGLVVIEQKGDLFRGVLDVIPDDRINDVIVLDVNDTAYPVGFNVLRQGYTANTVDNLMGVFKALYRDHPSMWAEQALYHGLHTLAADENATFIDLLALVSPTEEELNWSDRLRRQTRDAQHLRYWQSMENKYKKEQDARMEPLANRVWPMERTKLRNIVGQSKSTFTTDEVIQQNKILLVNLAGVEDGAATLMGTLIVSALWESVKRHPMPNSPNFLMLDEAHHFMNLPVDLGEMLVEARSFGLGIDFLHQGLYQLPNDMKAAIHQATQTKVCFQTTGDDAREMAKVMGSPISDHDISSMRKYNAVARIATPHGMSPPLTMATLDRPTGYGNTHKIIYASRGRYGRPVQQVEEEIAKRRISEDGSTGRRRGRPTVS